MTEVYGKTILLVEDDRSTAYIEKLILENHDFKVIIASTGEEAVDATLTHNEINLVLMDIDLGDGMDGTAAATAILAVRDIPVIFLSSHAEREIVEKTEGITSYGYILKNSGEAVLMAGIRMAFRLFEARSLERKKDTDLAITRDFNNMIIDMSPAFIVAIDPFGKTMMMNRSMLDALGYSFGEVAGKDYVSMIVPERDREELAAVFELIIRDREKTVNVNRILAKDGRELICEWHGIPVFKEGIYNFFIGVGLDITERVKAERESREHSGLRERLFASSKMPIIVMDALTYEYIECNAAAVEIYGFDSAADIIGKTPLDFSAQFQYDGMPSHEKAKNYIAEALSKGFVKFEWKHRRPDGSEWDAEVHLMRFNNNGNNYLQFTLIDISDRKKTERALVESEMLHASIINCTSDLIWSVDSSEFRIISYNVALKDYFNIRGIKFEIGSLPEDLLPAEVASIWREYYSRALRDKTFSVEYTSPVTGKILHFHFNTLKREGSEFGISVFGKDITEKKLAEVELESAKKKYQQILENSPVGIFQRKLQSNEHENEYTFFNGSLVEQFECSSKEEFLKNYSRVSDRWAELENYEKFKKELVENKKVSGWEIKTVLKTGKTKWFLMFAYLEETVSLINGFTIDITEIKTLERALKESEKEILISRERVSASLREKEALLKELYHRTKNNMQVMCAMISIQSMKFHDNDVLEAFKDLEFRIRSMALVHQKLYQSSDLSNINFCEYITDLADLMKKSFSVNSKYISIDLAVEQIMVTIDVAIPCGLILNELFSNSFKYAFSKEAGGTIRLSARIKGNDIIKFEYSDDGRGLPHGFEVSRDGKMGLQSIVSIVKNQLQGSIDIRSNNGFECDFSFNKSLYKARLP